MKTKGYQISVNGLEVQVIRKRIKNLNLAVYPPDGRVRVSVPASLSDEAVRSMVVGKLEWIRRKQARMHGQRRKSPVEIVTGETHDFRGQPYQLNVIEATGRPFVSLNGDRRLDLCVQPGMDRAARLAVLDRWYRTELRDLIPSLVAKWEPIVGVEIADCRIRRMKTRWGSCNIQASRIWLNLELVKKPHHCLEYVVVHEMVHLHERLHNDRFFAYMDKFMPDWRLHRDELNRRPIV